MTEPAPVEKKTDRTLSPWCNSVWKRGFDLLWAIGLLIASSPIMLIVAVAVKLSSPGPVFFRQQRPGKNRQEFSILKFRTMVVATSDAGPVLTRAMDPRVTWIGRHIRRWKLDELPQLFNVLLGQMSFVGPRPQPTKLWNDPSIRNDADIVLSVRPGITSQATLVFRNEEEVLAPLSVHEVEEVYVRTLMPLKLKIEIEYSCSASFLSDMQIILRTVGRVFNPRKEEDDHLKQFLPAFNKSRSNGRDEMWASSPLPSWNPLDLQEPASITQNTVSREEGPRT